MEPQTQLLPQTTWVPHMVWVQQTTLHPHTTMQARTVLSSATTVDEFQGATVESQAALSTILERLEDLKSNGPTTARAPSTKEPAPAPIDSDDTTAARLARIEQKLSILESKVEKLEPKETK